ncbi:hypothetical protein [Granulicella sp. L46]|uniref:hypothetical protein n=1 Tax=Granulicella sp. L46 TaxID=1641865 RepID=UPI00131E0EC8|nr:hypothetical protein [Granulicella sp. L46]
MDSNESEFSRPEAEANINRIKTSGDFLQWERESNERLYYALWILFMGGFVLSLQFSNRPDFYAAPMMKPALRLFRIVAVVGSALNFAMQGLTIELVNCSRLLSLEMSGVVVSIDAKNAHAGRKGVDELKRLWARLEKMGRSVSMIENGIRICGVLFLACALFISWNVFPVTTGKRSPSPSAQDLTHPPDNGLPQNALESVESPPKALVFFFAHLGKR